MNRNIRFKSRNLTSARLLHHHCHRAVQESERERERRKCGPGPSSVCSIVIAGTHSHMRDYRYSSNSHNEVWIGIMLLTRIDTWIGARDEEDGDDLE